MADTFLKTLTRSLTGGTPTATTPWNFVANAVSSVTGFLVNLATAAIGYSTGAGGTVTQITTKATGVTLNTPSGQIVMNNAQLAGTTSVQFTLTNSRIGANDTVVVNLASGNTAGSYLVSVDAVAAGSCVISLRNYSGGALSEAVSLNFNLIKGAIA